MCYVMADEGFLAWDKTITGPGIFTIREYSSNAINYTGSTLPTEESPYAHMVSTTLTKRSV